MKVNKKTSVGGEFAKAGQDYKTGEILVIKDEGTTTHGEYGEQLVFKVQKEGWSEPKNIGFNQTSINNLVDVYSEETKEWVGKSIKAEVIQADIAGRMRQVGYFMHPDWTMTIDAQGYKVFSPAQVANTGGVAAPSNPQPSTPDYPDEDINPEDIPF